MSHWNECYKISLITYNYNYMHKITASLPSFGVLGLLVQTSFFIFSLYAAFLNALSLQTHYSLEVCVHVCTTCKRACQCKTACFRSMQTCKQQCILIVYRLVYSIYIASLTQFLWCYMPCKQRNLKFDSVWHKAHTCLNWPGFSLGAPLQLVTQAKMQSLWPSWSIMWPSIRCINYMLLTIGADLEVYSYVFGWWPKFHWIMQQARKWKSVIKFTYSTLWVAN